MNIAFFDFDGTVTTKDSLKDFIIFATGSPRFWWGVILMSPILVAYKLRIISNNVAKEKFISYFFSGWLIDEFNRVASEYSSTRIKKLIRRDAQERLSWHKKNGDKIVIVTASIHNWLIGWVDECEYELLATELEVVDGVLTGNFSTNNCYGDEKVRRINLAYDISGFEKVYAYGDSSGDKPMLSLADESFYRYFSCKHQDQ